MKPESLFQISGISSVIGGIMIVLTRAAEILLFPGQSLSQQAVSNRFWMVGLLGLTGSLLVFAGIIGFYLWFAPQGGWLSFAAFGVAFTGIGLSLGMNWAYAFALPDISAMSPEYVDAGFPGSLGVGVSAAVGIGLLGWLLLGAAAYFSGGFPRWPAVVLILSVAALSIGVPGGRESAFSALLANLFIAAGPLAYGTALLREARRSLKERSTAA